MCLVELTGQAHKADLYCQKQDRLKETIVQKWLGIVFHQDKHIDSDSTRESGALEV